MSKQVDKTVLQKYLSGTCTKNELDNVKEYLDDEGYAASLEAWMAEDWRTFNTNTTKKKNIVFSLSRLAAAAVIICIVATAWLYARHRNITNNNNEWVKFANNAGKRSVLILPDSSKIFLGAASLVQYNKNYAITNRSIKLEGEAYFVVDHRHEHPFNVTTGALQTIDIGTEFNIRYLKTEPEIEVAVSRGAVDVLSNSGASLPIKRLNKSERLLFNDLTNTYLTDTIREAESIGGWRNGRLNFREKTLAQVAEELRRYYDIEVHFKNADSREILITTSLQNATIDDAIEIISITAGVEITKKGKIISIS